MAKKKTSKKTTRKYSRPKSKPVVKPVVLDDEPTAEHDEPQIPEDDGPAVDYDFAEVVPRGEIVESHGFEIDPPPEELEPVEVFSCEVPDLAELIAAGHDEAWCEKFVAMRAERNDLLRKHGRGLVVSVASVYPHGYCAIGEHFRGAARMFVVADLTDIQCDELADKRGVHLRVEFDIAEG